MLSILRSINVTNIDFLADVIRVILSQNIESRDFIPTADNEADEAWHACMTSLLQL